MSKNELTIQEKIAQLDQLLEWFNGDDFELEQASAKLKEAKKMADEIEHDLSTLENDITILKQSFASNDE